jgi:uncharacterized protein (DUF342 family)
MVSHQHADDSEEKTSSLAAIPANIATTLKVYPKVSLLLEGDNLVADLHPAKETFRLTEEQLQKEITRIKMADLRFDSAAVSSLLKQAAFNDAFSILIAKKIDATLTIKSSGDKLIAYAEFVPACGGRSFDESRIRTTLASSKITFGCVDEKTYAFIVGATNNFSLVIAKGRSAINGENATFDLLIEKRKSISTSIDENDIADFFDADMYPNVLEVDLLMKRSPATEGTDGVDIFGKILKSKKGKDTKFKKQKGTAVDAENENMLVATREGHPVVSAHGVEVDDVLVLPSVDIQTGNVTFDGSVLINGNVMSQMKIEVTGDIHVKGSVENANLKSGNNIIVGGGIISESIPGLDEPPKVTTVLEAGNDIHAMFFNLTDARAGNDILIQKYVLHSNIQAKHDIFVGDKGGKGAIICGVAECGHVIKANIIGSNAYLKTRVSFGPLEALRAKKRAIDKRLIQRSSEHMQLLSILEKVEAQRYRKSWITVAPQENKDRPCYRSTS